MNDEKDLFDHAYFATTHGLVQDSLSNLIRLFDEGGKSSEIDYVSVQRLSGGNSRLVVKYHTIANSNAASAEYWSTECRGFGGALAELESACKLGVFRGVPDGYAKQQRTDSKLVSGYKGDYDG